MRELCNKIKNEKGITLIALVITIVVLIVLAGVLINITLGDNGIINRSKDAKKQQQIASDKEQVEIVKGEVQAENNGTLTLDALKAKLASKGWSCGDIENDEFEATAPSGYKYKISLTKTQYIGTDGTVEDTLVISISASPASHTTTVQSLSINITINASEDILGDGDASYAWATAESSTGISGWSPLSLTNAGNQQRTSNIPNQGQSTDGNWYLFVKANINGKEETEHFGPYNFKAKPTDTNFVFEPGTPINDNTQAVTRLGSDTLFSDWTLTYKIVHADLSQETETTIASGLTDNVTVTAGDTVTLKYTKSGETPVTKDFNVSTLKKAFVLVYDVDGTISKVTGYDSNTSHTFTIKDTPADGAVDETTAKTFDGWYESKSGNVLSGTKHTTTSNNTITTSGTVTVYGTWRGLTAADLTYAPEWNQGTGKGTVASALDYLYTQLGD